MESERTQVASILVIEDDPDLRELLVESLLDEEYQVVGCADGEAALGVADQRTFDMVISDIRMAGADGLETLGRLRQMHPKMRGVVITGYADLDAPARAIQVGVWDYLYKPFTLDQLTESVRRVLEADQETEQAHALLSQLFSGYRRFLEAVSKSLSNARVATVEKKRQGAFGGFFIATRSKGIGRNQALDLWDRLEQLEKNRQTMFLQQDASLFPSLQEGYKTILEMLSRLTPEDVPPSAKRPEGAIAIDRFQQMVKRIENGHLAAHLLPMAPYLRQIPPASLEGSEQLRQLYDQVWGDS